MDGANQTCGYCKMGIPTSLRQLKADLDAAEKTEKRLARRSIEADKAASDAHIEALKADSEAERARARSEGTGANKKQYRMEWEASVVSLQQARNAYDEARRHEREHR